MNSLSLNRLLLAGALALGSATAAVAQPTIDGSISGDAAFYGAALSTQNTRTGYGDNSSPDPIVTADGGSEINQVFATVANDRLYVMVTGNLETNFNKMQFFFDTGAGGVNTIDGANLPIGVDGFCCGTTDPTMPAADGALQRLDGLTFDAGFNANYHMVMSNGGESVNGGDPDEDTQGFWGVSTHFTELDQGASGAVVSPGVQFAPRGLPNVLRTPIDYNRDGVVDGADYTAWRDTEGQAGDLLTDGNNDGTVGPEDYAAWVAGFGSVAALDGPAFQPTFDFQTTERQIAQGFTLPGLSQGQPVDSTYALGAGGCTDNEGNGCVAEELEFVLAPAADELDNGSNHRLFTNTIDMEFALDNSNVDGVLGGGFEAPLPGEAETATTGFEFSLPLSALGDPTGDIEMMAFVTNGGHDFVSNQFAGIGIQDANLDQLLLTVTPAVDRITLADILGDQFVTIANPGGAAATIPEPTTLAMVALGLVAGAAGRRR